jgi:hypothetical protein
MVWPFKRRRTNLSKKLRFKSGREFFEHQCKYGNTKLKINSSIVALVLDARNELGTPTAVSIRSDGTQLAALRVASEDGGFLVFSSTLSGKGQKLKPGDVVIWEPSSFNAELSGKTSDQRTGWIGFIRAKVKPVISLTGPKFEIACHFD